MQCSNRMPTARWRSKKARCSAIGAGCAARRRRRSASASSRARRTGGPRESLPPAGARGPSAASVGAHLGQRLLHLRAAEPVRGVQVDLALARRRRRRRRTPASRLPGPSRRSPRAAESHAAASRAPAPPSSPDVSATSSGGAAAMAASSAASGAAAYSRDEQRVEIGPRLVLGLDPVMQRDRGLAHRAARCRGAEAALVLHQVDHAAVGAHLQPVERARFGEHRVSGQLGQHVADHLVGAPSACRSGCT